MLEACWRLLEEAKFPQVEPSEIMHSWWTASGLRGSSGPQEAGIFPRKVPSDSR